MVTDIHATDCVWECTTSTDCEYRDTHHYCPHLEHACTCPVWNPTEEEAEAILRENGTSTKEVINGFIERLLKERSNALAALSSRDKEIREVLEGLVIRHYDNEPCWCDRGRAIPMGLNHEPACLAARGLWDRLQS